MRPNVGSTFGAGFLVFFVEFGLGTLFGDIDFFFAAFGVTLAVFEALFACGLNPSCGGCRWLFFVVLPGDILLA